MISLFGLSRFGLCFFGLLLVVGVQLSLACERDVIPQHLSLLSPVIAAGSENIPTIP